MGHNIRHFTYSEKVDKKKVQHDCDRLASMDNWGESGGCGGLNGNIRWIDHVCEDYESAMKYIESHDKGWYDQLAVKYYTYEHKASVPTKKLSTLEERLSNETNKRIEYANAHSVRAFKAEFVGCPCCGSKLKKELLSSENCPLCRTDMRSKTTIDTLARYSANITALKEQIYEERDKIEKKGRKPTGIEWLVKIEYHT